MSGIAIAGWAPWMAAIGLLLLFSFLVYAAWWALFSDPPRGRRRCPRCWHDLTYTPGMTCSECGLTARSEHDLGLPHRRPGIAALAFLGCAMIGAYVVDHVNSRGWLSYAPAGALIAALPLLDDPGGAVFVELNRRLRADALSDGQWLDLVHRTVRGDGGAPPGSAAWVGKYGPFASAAQRRAAGSDDRVWAAEVESLLWEVPPQIVFTTRRAWPEGVGPTVDALVRDWWPAYTTYRIVTASDVEGASTDTHVLRDASVQRRSYSIQLPPLPPGDHEVGFDVTIERRSPTTRTWRPVDRRSLRVPLTVQGELHETMAAVGSAKMDELVRLAFRRRLVKYTGGSLPVRMWMDPRQTFVPSFDDTAVAVRIDVLRNGRLARQLDIWWRAGSEVADPQFAWEVPWHDDAILGAPDGDDDAWALRVRSVPELALRVKGVSRYWEGEVLIPVGTRPGARRAPPRGWIPAADADADDGVADDAEDAEVAADG